MKKLFERYPGAKTFVVADTSLEGTRKVVPIPDGPVWPNTLSSEEHGQEEIEPPQTNRPLEGIKILLDAGHSKSRRGASGLPPDRPDEWEHNVYACVTMKPILEQAGAVCHYEDPDPDNLVYMGKLAKGFNLAIYSHHNAFDKDGVDEGHSIYIHPNASTRAKRFAELATRNISEAIGAYNRGVKEKTFTVLKGAFDVGCPIAVLPEYYFIDDYGHTSVTMPKTKKAAKALAQTIIDFFGGRNNRDTEELRRGSKGSEVISLQKLLNSHGYLIEVDGDFGPETETALNRFQHSQGLTANGIVDGRTWEKLWEKPTAPPSKNVMSALAKIAEKYALEDYKESDGSYNYFRKKFLPKLGNQNWAWCAAFVHKCLEEASGKSLPIDPKTGPATFALVETWQQWAIKKGYWVDAPGANPPIGAIVVFDWDGARYPDTDWENHIGVLVKREKDVFVCAEGNVKNRTMIKRRYLSKIQGFIILPDDFTV